jgi:hypothetical protein
MRAYVREALDYVKSEGGIIQARKFREYLGSRYPWIQREQWYRVNAPIKDEPIDETGEILVPVGKAWYYNPSPGILVLWVKETLERHKAEVERACKALTLPRYIKSQESKRTLPELYELRDTIERAIKRIEG